MIEKIKKFIYAVRINEKLEKDIVVLQDKINELDKKVGDPKYVVEKVMGRGIGFYDISQVESEEHKRVYQKNCDDILRNEAFKNEVNSIIADCVEYCAKESPNHEKTLGARMTINGLELLRQRFADINVVSDKKEIKIDDMDKIYNEHY